MNKSNFILWIVFGLISLSIFFFSSIVALITDLWWFSEIGYLAIFLKTFIAKAWIFAAVSIFSFIFILINLLAAVKSKTPWMIILPESIAGQPLSIGGWMIKKIGIYIALALSLIFGQMAALQWQNVLKFLSSTPFGTVDPIFGKDISFYIFSLPVIHSVLSFLTAIILLSITFCAVIYVLRGNLNITSFFDRFKGFDLKSLGLSFLETEQKETLAGARIHIAILLALLFATIAASTYFSMFKLLTIQSGQVFGAVFTDVHVSIPMFWVSLISIIFVVLASLHWGKSGKTGYLLAAIILYFFVGLASNIVPSIVQQLIVAPNELAKETPYIKHNIMATRQAFGLDKVEELEISGDKPLSASDIARNNLTIKNVRLWDRGPLLSTFSQIQEIRTYYEFASVDNDRYTIDGEIRQIMLSPRELSSDSLPNKSWINERLSFTHGYGIAAGPVNQVTAGGLPVLFVKDLPPQSDIKEMAITRPELYYGEKSNDYVFVKTKSKEFDYPKGEENVFSTYTGKGGVEINSLFRRLLYSIHLGSLKLLLSNDITKESRILYNRNILERLSKIAPFLIFDRDPYIVVAEGKIYWIADAYTTSDLYPYSQRLQMNSGQVNYIKNSIKAVVDAYDGSVTFYLLDTEDPIIRTYSKIFPDMFRALSKMPKSLSSHLRYPEDIFTLQTFIYTIYHMDDPQTFYNKEDQWEIPTIPIEGEENSAGINQVMSPRHMIMKLPAEKKEEYILMLPFTPRSKDNLSAWMVARNDGANYGKLQAYRFPKQKLIFGPKQVIGRINQDSEISRQISLWDQRGSTVIQGSLLVIPIEESLIYVRPLYLKADAGKIPELKRVLVSYENKVAMEETLEAGLARIFGGSALSERPKSFASQQLLGSQNINTSHTKDLQETIRQAVSAYEASLRAQREGDWSRYGEEIKKLGDILKRLHP